MQDLKLYTEILHAVENGIITTKKGELNALYRKYDKEFPRLDEFYECLKVAFDRICTMDFLKGSDLAKPYVIYSLALALIHGAHTVPNFEQGDVTVDFASGSTEGRLLELSTALDLDEEEAKDSPFKEFIAASSDRTNVKAQRETRVRWFIKALSGTEG